MSLFAPANIALVVVALLASVVLFRPRLLGSQTWQATVTPLASIIGSGFLVAGPILAGVAGNLAIVAMLGLCALGYLFGAAVRHNIEWVEPEMQDDPPRLVRVLERASELSLAIAYFVSVAYYLHLFAAFGLRLGGLSDEVFVRAGATVVIAGVGLVGLTKGLDGLERIAVGAVALKLALILALFAALAVATVIGLGHGDLSWDVAPPSKDLHDLRILLGLVVLVQGFETSRFLGAAYDRQTRIRTMRHAQWIATAVYGVFFLLITAWMTGGPVDASDETAIIDALRPVALLVPLAVTVTALASQLSAGVADMNGAGGLLSEGTGRRLSVRWGNALTAVVAIAVIWLSDILEIITLASRLFVIFYALQSAQAAWSAWRHGQRARAGLFAGGVVVAAIVAAFAVPAGA